MSFQPHSIAPVVVTALVAVLGCGGPEHYLHPQADVSAMKRVAVLPFEASGSERGGAEKVQKIFTTELLLTGAFDVVEPGLVTKAMREARTDSVETLTPADMKKLGEALGAEGLFIGTVIEFADARSSGNGGGAEVRINLRLIEAQTGVTVWSAAEGRSGPTVMSRLFGFGSPSSAEAARDIVRRELATLVR